MRRPGHLLRTLAAHVCSPQTIAHIVDPTIADIDTEYAAAVAAGCPWRARWMWVRGCVGFWKAVGLRAVLSSPRVLGTIAIESRTALARIVVPWVIVFVAATIAFVLVPIRQLPGLRRFSVVPLLLPQAIPLSVPLALAIAIAWSGQRTARNRGMLALSAAASLLAFAATLVFPATNQAFRLAVFEHTVRPVATARLPKGVNELSLSELAAKIRQPDSPRFQPLRRRIYRRAYHTRLALPAATFVLSLLAIAIGRMMRARVRRVIAVTGAIAAFYTAWAVAQRTSSLSPALSVWAPDIVFAAIGAVLLVAATDHRPPASAPVEDL